MIGWLSSSWPSAGWRCAGWLSVGVLVLGPGRRSVRWPDRVPARRSTRHGDTARDSRARLALIAGAAVVGLCWSILGASGLLIAPLAVPAAVLAVRRVAVSARRTAGPDPRQVALLIDLLAGALEAGLPIDRSLAAVADAASMESTGRAPDAHPGADVGRAVAGGRSRSRTDLADAAAPLGELGRLLSLGAEPEAAWSRLAGVPNFAAVALAGRRCAHSGARLAQALRSAAEQLRDQRQAESVAKADRCGVWVLLPLGLCFLPAFVCLGIVPTILGVARGTGIIGAGLP